MSKEVFKIFEFDDYDILVNILPGEENTKVTFTIQSAQSIKVTSGRTFETESEGREFYNCLDEPQVWTETENLRLELKEKVKERYLEDQEKHKSD